ncbi:uncharacterized protein LOC110453452 [Mizuhopecten yessoensis]|uniref:uncharacterized protein LOC110453452 n=1 Tax=Mizuhopecten yessoensis TaxID=6573 RepID=UPI000B45A524|nr:uncharacterized protein LOC110453452 [Mizuhopecten yessoensis]
MRDNMCLLLFLLVVGLTYLQAAVPQNKRQGMFGLCQGWGAGCSMNYRSQNRSHSKSSTSNPAPNSRSSRYSVPSYLFTSGSSWNPIGKRSTWYTDIAFLRSPLVSLLNLKKPKENRQYALRYPLVFRSKQPVH